MGELVPFYGGQFSCELLVGNQESGEMNASVPKLGPGKTNTVLTRTSKFPEMPQPEYKPQFLVGGRGGKHRKQKLLLNQNKLNVNLLG